MNVPDRVQAGEYTVVLQAFSEETYPDASGRETRIRDTVVLLVTVDECHSPCFTVFYQAHPLR